jgi:hypothetical protein
MGFRCQVSGVSAPGSWSLVAGHWYPAQNKKHNAWHISIMTELEYQVIYFYALSPIRHIFYPYVPQSLVRS